MPLSAALLCLVIGIADGDTLTARCDTPAGRQTLRVRIAEVDAPERAQPYGRRSRQHLAALCHRQRARVHLRGEDRYGRTLAHVNCNGTDAGTEQVRAGLAWVFEWYAVDGRLYAIQAEAKKARRGLWADREPVAPWRWRRRGHASID